jgi:uncharacterized repeat protein (TIGR03803 family)
MTATLMTLVGFDGADGTNPGGSLIADSNGDIFGTTIGGPDVEDPGTVFEIDKTVGGYDSAPTTLVTFNGDDGADPGGGLIADVSGDLFGTTEFGSTGNGTVFEIVKTFGSYGSTPTTLASFDDVDGSRPMGSLVADANGDLFGTTEFGGPSDEGAVFEIAKTPTGYASTPTRLVGFNGPDGALPQGTLIADANGDLFGVTEESGPDDLGTVFEIAKTATGYASTPTTLVSFADTDDGFFPMAGLVADANGDLFGTTSDGGAIDGDGGVVFEIAKTAGGYASTSTTLVNFTGADGETPMAGLLIDPTATYSARRITAAPTTLARCSRSRRLPPATPARRPYWSALTAPMATTPKPASSPTPTATFSAQPPRVVPTTTTSARCSRSPTAALLPRPRRRRPPGCISHSTTKHRSRAARR